MYMLELYFCLLRSFHFLFAFFLLFLFYDILQILLIPRKKEKIFYQEFKKNTRQKSNSKSESLFTLNKTSIISHLCKFNRSIELDIQNYIKKTEER